MVGRGGRSAQGRQPFARHALPSSTPYPITRNALTPVADSVRSVVLDLNADLGEGYGVWTLTEDAALLDVVTSANVACGFHAGDPSIMATVCAGAVARGVRIGAQVSYRDRAGFGRRPMPVTAAELRADVTYQIGALQAVARAAGGQVGYVKPHGALYNLAATDDVQAGAVAEAVASCAAALPVLGLPDSALAEACSVHGLAFVAEGFADRAYSSGGRLVARSEPGAVLHDPDEVAARAVRMALEGTVVAVDGSVVAVPVRSVCLHGDTPGAVHIARRVRAALTGAGVTLSAFV